MFLGWEDKLLRLILHVMLIAPPGKPTNKGTDGILLQADDEGMYI